MKKRAVIFTMIITAYCACYNIIEHGAEKTFFIGLIAAVGFISAMNFCLDSGFRIYPEEPDFFDEYFSGEDRQ